MVANVGGVPQSVAAMAAKGALASIALLGNSFRKTAGIANNALGSINKSLQSNVSNIGNLGKGVSGLGNSFTGLATVVAIAGAALALPFIGLKNALQSANDSSKDFLNTVGTIMGITDASFGLASEKMLAYKKVVSETASSIGVDVSKANKLVTATIDDLILISTKSNGFIDEDKIKENIASMTLLSSKMSEQDMMFAQKGLNKFLDPGATLGDVLKYDFFTNVGLTPVLKKQLREQGLDFDKLNRNERAKLLQSVIKSTTGADIIKAQAKLIGSQLTKFKTELFDADFGKFGINRQITTSSTEVKSVSDGAGLAGQGATDVLNSTDTLIKALGFVADPMVVIAEKLIGLRTFFDGLAKTIDVVTKSLPKDATLARQKILELVQKKIYESIRGVGSFLRTEFIRFAKFITSPQTTGFISGVITATGRLISDAATQLNSDIKTIDLGAFLAEKLALLTNWFRNTLFGENTNNVGGSVSELMGTVFTAIGDFITNTFTNIFEFINSEEGKDFSKDVQDGIGKIATGISNYIQKSFDWLVTPQPLNEADQRKSLSSLITNIDNSQQKSDPTFIGPVAQDSIVKLPTSPLQKLGQAILNLAIAGIGNLIKFLQENDIGKMASDKANGLMTSLTDFFKSDQGIKLAGGLGVLIGSLINVVTRFLNGLDVNKASALIESILYPALGAAALTIDWGALIGTLFKVVLIAAIPGLLMGLVIMFGLPFLLIAAGIIALGYIIVKNWKDIQADLKTNWDIICTNIDKFGEALKNGIKYLVKLITLGLGIVYDIFTGDWEGAKSKIKLFVSAISDGVTTITDWIKRRLGLLVDEEDKTSILPPTPVENQVAEIRKQNEALPKVSVLGSTSLTATPTEIPKTTPLNLSNTFTINQDVTLKQDSFLTETSKINSSPAGIRANGNYPTIYQAMIAEMKAMPSGASPVVANSSELIIPQKDIKSFIKGIQTGKVKTANEGNLLGKISSGDSLSSIAGLFKGEFKPFLDNMSKIFEKQGGKQIGAISEVVKTVTGEGTLIEKGLSLLNLFTKKKDDKKSVNERLSAAVGLPTKADKQSNSISTISDIVKTVTGAGSIPEKLLSVIGLFNKDKDGKPKEGGTISTISNIAKTVLGQGSLPEKLLSVVNLFTKNKDDKNKQPTVGERLSKAVGLPTKEEKQGNTLSTVAGIAKTVMGEGSIPEKLMSVVGLFTKGKDGTEKEGGTMSTISNVAKTVMGEGTLVEKAMSIFGSFTNKGQDKSSNPISNLIQGNKEKYAIANPLPANQPLVPSIPSPIAGASLDTNLNSLYKDALQSQNLGKALQPFLNVPSVEERKNDEQFTSADTYGIKENNEPLFNPIAQNGAVNNTSNVGGSSKEITINAYFSPTINNAGQGTVENLEGQFGEFQVMFNRVMSEGIGTEH